MSDALLISEKIESLAVTRLSVHLYGAAGSIYTFL